MQNQDNQFGLWNRTAQDQPIIGTIDQLKLKANVQVQEIMKNTVVIQINNKIDSIKEDLKEEYSKMDSKAQLMLQSQKEKMNIWIRQKLEIAILQTLEKIKPTLLDMLKDPYMCEYVTDLTEDVFEEIWPDIRDQILFQIRLKYADPYELVLFKQPQMCCIFWPWFYLKTWYLYTFIPCKYMKYVVDKSIWERFRWLSWWFIFIIKLIPFYGIQAFIYIFVFLFIDKKDEYQLVTYILKFKSMQFITIGIIGTMIGYFTFYSCAVVSKLDSNYDSCREEGPAIFLNFWSDIFGFLMQLLFIWITFFLLPFSKCKGKVIFKHQQQDEIEKGGKHKQSQCFCCQLYTSRGGRLKCFMIYDIIMFFGCVALFLALSITDGERQLWQYKSTMYLVKTIYGILSFPFLIFNIPGLTWVLTRSHGTGYDRIGNCVPIVQDLNLYHKRNKETHKPFDAKYIKQDDTIDLLLNQELMEEILV